ncbi:MAG: hypothetical protein SGBAC_010213 [Bacillariaceae sp.]
MGGIQIPNQVFAQASSTINTTNVCDEVGLLGLGFSDISSQNFPALLSNLKEQDITMFSLYLTDHNDYQVALNKTTHFEDPISQTPPTSTAFELTLGGVNPERYRDGMNSVSFETEAKPSRGTGILPSTESRSDPLKYPLLV